MSEEMIVKKECTKQQRKKKKTKNKLETTNRRFNDIENKKLENNY